MGLGKTVQAIAMLTSEREQFGAEAFGPTLVVCPMSVTRQWAREIERFAPSLRVHLHHGGERLSGAELVEVARSSDVVITSYDIATRDIDDARGRCAGTGCCSTRRRTSRTPPPSGPARCAASTRDGRSR